MAKVIVGMSGGVDSAVAAYLLKMAGHEVIGLTLRTWLLADGKESKCCEIDDARRVARELGIPYYVQDCISEFESNVTQPFIEEYKRGRTPNPCVRCNRYLKWDKMLQSASAMRAEYIATGHYARVVRLGNGRYTFQAAADAKKDQTYMLYALRQDQIAATLMPLWDLSKARVRRIAEGAGLPVAQKPDSQEICFVSEGRSYADYIEEHEDTDFQERGNFVDTKGNILGEHKGIIHYTVGQRKGLGLAFGYPVYVKEIRPLENEVVIGNEEDLYSKTIICDNINLMSIGSLNGRMQCNVKIRYQHAGEKAFIEMEGAGRIRVTFDGQIKAAAPGQAAVFYDENGCLVGGGRIIKAGSGSEWTN